MIRRFGMLMSMMLTLAAPIPASAEQRIAVISNVGRSVALSTEELAQIYLKKRRFWSDGEAIVPLNRDARSEARALFTSVVLGAEVRALEVYWNRQYFSGVLPPATLASDEAVKRFVADRRNAIGYIDARSVDESVRVVLILER